MIGVSKGARALRSYCSAALVAGLGLATAHAQSRAVVPDPVTVLATKTPDKTTASDDFRRTGRNAEVTICLDIGAVGGADVVRGPFANIHGSNTSAA